MRSSIALITFIVCLFMEGGIATANRGSLLAVEIEKLTIRENLLPNFSFEEIQQEKRLPSGWIWDRRNTDATCELDNKKVHSGKYSLKFRNTTPFGAHIYGTLWTAQPIHLSPGKPYTLSAYVLSFDPGVAWIGGGGNWQIRLYIPPTGGKWERIWLTFTPSEADADFVLRINTDSPTKGFWVDDLKLEEGNEPTPCFSTLSRLELEALWDEKKELSGDGEFSLPFLIYSPRESTVQLSAQLGVSPLFKKEITIPAGVSRLTLKGKAIGLSGPQVLNLSLYEGRKKLLASNFSAYFLSSSDGETRLKKIVEALPSLKKAIEELRKKDEDLSYPMVTYTVLENFTKYTEGDLAYYREKKAEWVLKRALFAIDDMEKMLRRLENQLKLAKNGKLHFPRVPRWTGDERPQIAGSSFIGPTRTLGSSPVRRPIFFNGYGAFGQVREDIEKFPNYGVNIIQIEVGPSGIFPREGEVLDAPIKGDILPTLDRARKAGVAINLLISPHYFPAWVLEKYPQLRKRREGFLQYCLHAPESKELLLRYIRTLIPPLKDHPALHSICLTNEPVNLEEPCEYALKDWHEWLRRKHKDIAALNKLWGTNYSSFGEIPLPNPFTPGFTLQTPLGMDYVLFNQEWFAGWHKMLADAIHEIAPDLPVHAKAMTWTLIGDTDVRLGVDAELFADFSQINGNDSVNFYSHGQGEFAHGWLGNLMPYDLQRSMKNVPIFNSENHLILDRETRYIPPEHIRCALWQQAIYGQGASTIWVWERTYDPKSDFAGSIMERPLSAEAVGIVNYDLNRLAEYVTAIQNIKPQATLIMSTSAKLWDVGRYGDCLEKLYIALTFCGVRVGFISERQLERGELPSTPLLFVPNIAHISDKAFEGLKNYRGKIILLGDEEVLRFNEYNKRRGEEIAGERLEYRYGETSWRDLWLKLRVKLREWGGKPLIEVVEKSGKPIWGVAWLSTRVDEGILVNICNYRNEKVELKIKNGGKFALDLISGEKISPYSLTLSPLEFRLLLLKEK